MAQALLTLQDILVRHGESTVLQVSCLDVQPGEILAIIGPNGAGKSTLLRVMGLLQQPTAGKVYFQGEEIRREKTLLVRRQMASVFQEPLLLNASVYDNAALGLKIRGLRRNEIQQRLRPWLERLCIAHLSLRRVKTLSGGELQRTSLARALALDPQLLLLDEPFSALDPPTRESLLLDLQEILRQTGVTTVFVTHDRHEAFMLGNRVGVLNGGRLIQLGPSLEVFTRPLDEEVAEIIGTDNRIRGIMEANTGTVAKVRFDGGVAEVISNFEPGAQVVLCIRPEDITLSPPGNEPRSSPMLNHLKVRVLRVIPWALQYRLALQCGGTPLIASITRTSFLELGVREGDELSACFSAAAVHVIRAQSKSTRTFSHDR